MTGRRVVVWARRLLLVAVLVALVAGLGDRDEPEQTALPELDVLVVVDRTTSMSARDVGAGDRLSAAKRDLLALGQQLESARFTVLAVDREPGVVLPATSDRVAWEEAVTAFEVEPADAGSGSSVNAAVPLAQRLIRPDDEGRRAVLVYAGDGEDNPPSARTGSGFQRLDREVEAALVLGYGTEEGGTMPLVEDGVDTGLPVPDARTGQPAVSRASPHTLAAVADELGGTYVQGSGAARMADVAADLERAAYAGLPPVRPARQLGWAWGLGLLLLVLPELGSGWRGWLTARQGLR